MMPNFTDPSGYVAVIKDKIMVSQLRPFPCGSNHTNETLCSRNTEST